MSGSEELRALVEALKPFAAFADQIAKERPGWDHDGFTFGGPLEDTRLTMGDFRRARAAFTRAESSLASPAGMEGWTRAVRDVFEIELKINRAEPMEAMERALAAASVEFAASRGDSK